MATEVTCSVSPCVVQIEPAPLSEERAADMLALFWLFVLALVMVWGWKQILNIFTSNGD